MGNKNKLLSNNFIIILIVLTSICIGFFVGSLYKSKVTTTNKNDIQVNITSNNSDKNTIEEKININKATLEELKELQGVGEEKAQMIIANRPYKNIHELLDKKIVEKDVFKYIKK